MALWCFDSRCTHGNLIGGSLNGSRHK
ncbi:hypothetical protein YPPY76_2963, partial [Yersinia pestis PY-76]